MNTTDIIEVCLNGIAIVSVIVFLIIWMKAYKREKLKKKTSVPKEEYKVEFETVKVHAKVVDLSCRVDLVGIKMPKAVDFFTVTFETDDKEIIRVDVSQEMYDGLVVGQIGEVTLVEGDLYSFIV